MLPLPEWVDGKRALKALGTALRDRGLTHTLQAYMLDTPTDNQPVMLPGFTIFDRATDLRASDWCVARPNIDRDELIAIYEAYVDRRLGHYNSPERAAKVAYRGPAAESMFGPRRKAKEWWLPVATLIAITSHVAKEPALYTKDSVTLDMGDFRMSAAPEGCWSNFRGRIVGSVEPPDDADIEQLTVPPLLTRHPLAKSLVKMQVPSGLLWAANSVVRAEAQGDIKEVRFAHVKPRKPGRAARVSRKKDDESLLRAIRECRQSLVAPYEGSLLAVYKVAVPALMTRLEFGDLIAYPGAEGRALTEEQVAEMYDYLDYRERSCSPA